MSVNRIAYTSDNPTLDLRMILKRIKQRNLEYIFGRFWTFRKIYAYYMKFKQVIYRKDKYPESPSQILNSSIFQVKEIVDSIRKMSYYDKLELPRELVNSIVKAVYSKDLSSALYPSTFRYQEYISKLKFNENIAMGRVEQPLEIQEVSRLRHDSLLIKIAESYLGYYPENCDVQLWYSFANNLSVEERRNQCQTIDYHYDIHGFNFFYVSFYLSDVDINSGAHVLVKSSHRHKPLKMLFRSARCPDQTIHDIYSEEDIVVIEGKAGKCFLEDASCFHKALPPVEKDRLFLQFRYF